jgi:hypothetical protein
MLKENGKNSVKKGELIYGRTESVSQIGIVLSGKVLMQEECMKILLPQGSYLALNVIDDECYKATYTAVEDSVIYAIPVNGSASIKNIISKNADYRAIMITSQFRMAMEMHRLKTSLSERAQRLYSFTENAYDEYKTICNENSVAPLGMDELEELTPYEGEEYINEYRYVYYDEASKIPLSANKAYFSHSIEMAHFQVNEIIEFVRIMREDCIGITEYIKSLISVICQRPNKNLYELICQKAREIQKNGELPISIIVLINGIVDEAELQYKELNSQCENLPELNTEHLKNLMNGISGKKVPVVKEKSAEEKQDQIKRDMESLKNSMSQIIRFGNISDEDAEKLTTNINYLVNAEDRLSIDDDIKKAKKIITPIVFKLYLSCYRRIKEGLIAAPKAVELFMNFGMLDERLLDTEQLEFLCGVEPEINEGPCKVVTMMEWLDMIYEGTREPSKSELDEDYSDHLRTLKKQAEITDKELQILLKDMDKRVEYEVLNMQMSNSRTVYGQPSSYMPVLYKEAIFGYLDSILVTKAKINESVKKLLKTDYSAFYRDVIYSNTDIKITNETVVKNVYPDIILMPLFGTNASMWQEIGSKDKKTPGRFCFPIMTSTNIDELMVKLFGRFRWELCRCIQGMSWNDVKIKSLTSEYMDYLQFYKKNRDLSEEAKDKIKLQIQKSRNNTREAFLIDYEIWIKNEANGSMKLNKVAREIMATYCPFEKELRTKLNTQKPYEVAQARHTRTCLKKKQELDLKIRAIQKITSDIPDEIMDTYKFYGEM